MTRQNAVSTDSLVSAVSAVATASGLNAEEVSDGLV